ncbi:hypothetical protein CM15mP35_03030 [bacterium]|nr:MAG: hypothetical protein CM15mP35_03030 [bacterium]
MQLVHLNGVPNSNYLCTTITIGFSWIAKRYDMSSRQETPTVYEPQFTKKILCR